MKTTNSRASDEIPNPANIMIKYSERQPSYNHFSTPIKNSPMTKDSKLTSAQVQQLATITSIRRRELDEICHKVLKGTTRVILSLEELITIVAKYMPGVFKQHHSKAKTIADPNSPWHKLQRCCSNALYNNMVERLSQAEAHKRVVKAQLQQAIDATGKGLVLHDMVEMSRALDNQKLHIKQLEMKNRELRLDLAEAKGKLLQAGVTKEEPLTEHESSDGSSDDPMKDFKVDRSTPPHAIHDQKKQESSESYYEPPAVKQELKREPNVKAEPPTAKAAKVKTEPADVKMEQIVKAEEVVKEELLAVNAKRNRRMKSSPSPDQKVLRKCKMEYKDEPASKKAAVKREPGVKGKKK